MLRLAVRKFPRGYLKTIARPHLIEKGTAKLVSSKVLKLTEIIRLERIFVARVCQFLLPRSLRNCSATQAA